MDGYLKSKISAMVRALLAIHGESNSSSSARFHDVLQFVLDQLDRMPWFTRFAVKTMTLYFALTGSIYSRPTFPGGAENSCRKHLEAWSRSTLRPCRDFVKFYAGMVVLSLYSDSRALDREGL